MTEIWKQFDDRYSISNFGRVKSNYANKERILKPFKNQDGYLMVDIRHGEYRKGIGVHRMVAMCFLDNPNNYNEVNHKDENKENNCVDNLEWCNTKYNCNYGTRNKRKGEHCQKPIYSVDKYGNIINYPSVQAAAKAIGKNSYTISKALSDNYIHKTAYGYHWYYGNA